MFYHIYFTDFLKNRVQTVQKAESQQEALEIIQNNERAVNAVNIVQISEAEYHKFKAKWYSVAA